MADPFVHHGRDVMIVNARCANDVACGRFKQHFSFTKSLSEAVIKFSTDCGQLDIDDFQSLDS